MITINIYGTPPSDAQSLRTFAYSATTAILILSTFTLALRLFARVKLQSGLELDDYLMVAGYLVSLDPVIALYIMLAYGLGYHQWNLDHDTFVSWLKTYFALQRANQIALALIKCSILVFYMRIFVTRSFKVAAWTIMAFTLLWAVVTWCINLTVCSPISYFWDKTIPGGKCASQQVTGAVSGALGALGDVLILGLPLTMLRGLKLNARKKVALSGIFLLGAFTCVASVVRIVEVSKAVPTDLPYTNASASTWTTMEMQVAIFSANLPSLAPLFGHFFRNKKGTTPSFRINTSGQSRSKSGQRGPMGTHKPTSVRLTSSDGFHRMSDDDLYSQSKVDSLRDMELGDRTTLVNTEQGCSAETKSPIETDAYELQAVRVQSGKR
ncbi:hypothetical protein VM1G_01243 [Cytospora mali]|uniref:Rhodopsin domain-containing protein n=1 Tax=Cytospora mali TaxID=578113 RepID=A0A194VLH0_CYTMA|nr:hypothetical protein VM1G_01243 [Valsa mali]